MRYHEIKILNETSLSTPDNIEEVVAIIKKDCRPYLNEAGIQGCVNMYRGIMDTNDNFFITKRVRLDNRRPSSTPSYIHDYLNDSFKKYYGEPFRNSVFCTGNLSLTMAYGEPFMVFPIGDFSYCWSPDIEDLYDKLSRNDKYYDKHDLRDQSELDDMVLRRYIANERLLEAIQSEVEIMIRCQKYHAIMYSKDTQYKVLQELHRK